VAALRRSFHHPSVDLTETSILITGGTGSFSRAFARRLMSGSLPRRVVLLSRDEQKQQSMADEFKQDFPEAVDRLRFFIGDIRDMNRLELAMRDINIVVHTAALKIIPVAEYNPFECILTNVHGIENLVKVALRCGVSKVISLSTDKAVNPINLYGASKLAADKIVVAANNLSGLDGPIFSVVRYGNVFGSRGSIVPLLQRCVSSGAKSVPITDPRMTRFWITLEQGVSFVLSSLALMAGGEIFIPKLPSMRITDLAEVIAPGLGHKFIGIRPGEKLHECLISADESRATVELDDRFVIVPPIPQWSDGHLQDLGGRPVVEGFQYSSDSNTEWLEASTLADWL